MITISGIQKFLIKNPPPSDLIKNYFESLLFFVVKTVSGSKGFTKSIHRPSTCSSGKPAVSPRYVAKVQLAYNNVVCSQFFGTNVLQ